MKNKIINLIILSIITCNLLYSQSYQNAIDNITGSGIYKFGMSQIQCGCNEIDFRCDKYVDNIKIGGYKITNYTLIFNSKNKSALSEVFIFINEKNAKTNDILASMKIKYGNPKLTAKNYKLTEYKWIGKKIEIELSWNLWDDGSKWNCLRYKILDENYNTEF